MLLGSCGQKQETPSASSQDTAQVSVSDTAKAVTSSTPNSQTANEIRQFVSNTYTEVFAAYTQEHLNEGNGPDRSVFDKKFLSKRLQKAIDSEEMIDCDYWLHAQDFTTPVFDIKDVHATDENTEGGSNCLVHLSVVKRSNGQTIFYITLLFSFQPLLL